MEELENIAEVEDFPMGVDRDVLGIAVVYGKHFLEEKETDMIKAIHKYIMIFQKAQKLI